MVAPVTDPIREIILKLLKTDPKERLTASQLLATYVSTDAGSCERLLTTTFTFREPFSQKIRRTSRSGSGRRNFLLSPLSPLLLPLNVSNVRIKGQGLLAEDVQKRDGKSTTLSPLLLPSTTPRPRSKRPINSTTRQ